VIIPAELYGLLCVDGAVMVCEINNEVNDRPVGKPQEQGVMNIAASFSLSKKPRLSIQ
jgi:hypothetical protein